MVRAEILAVLDDSLPLKPTWSLNTVCISVWFAMCCCLCCNRSSEFLQNMKAGWFLWSTWKWCSPVVLTSQLQPLLLAEAVAGAGVSDTELQTVLYCMMWWWWCMANSPACFGLNASLIQPCSLFHFLRKIQGCGPRQGCGTGVASCFLGTGENGSNFSLCAQAAAQLAYIGSE